MVRKLIKVLLAGSMLIPTLGFALGLGDINLRSGLNQQLNAEIELLSLDPDDIGRVSVTLANAETFSKLGVDRPLILQDLKFEVLKNSNGVPYIKVTSKNLINEPFLDFLVEVTWPNGKVLREYTLLLEPPEMARQEPLLLDTPQTYEQPVITEAPRPVQEPASVVPEPLVSAPVDMAGEMPAGEQPPAAQGEPTAAAPSTEPSVVEAAGPSETVQEPERTTGRFPVEGAPGVDETATTASEALVYGPVKRNEYLYRIAKRMRPDESVSVEQMMIALFNANRKAFIHNNINLLRKGAVLRIEDPAILHALSHAEARREVARHGRAWEEYRREVAARTPESVPVIESQEPAKTGAAAVAPVKDEPKLSLVAPEKQGAAGKGRVSGTDAKAAETVSLRKELMLATETAEARRQENEELNKRLKELEGQLQNMQKLLTLKSDEMAALQKQKEAKAAAASTPQADKGAPVQAMPEKATVELSTEAPAQPAPQETAPVPAEPESKVPPVTTSDATTPAAGETVVASGTAAPATPEVAASEAPKPEVAAAPAVQDKPKPKPVVPKKPRPVQPPPPEPSFFEQLLNDPMMLGGGIAGVVILILAVLMLIRKRRQGRGFQESILTVGATSSMMKGKGDNPASETSFLSDLAISGMGGRVHEEGDVDDPLTEADVYLTYNKFQTAEDLLKEALIHTPERDELHAKLLEVYYKANNQEAFEQHAAERAASLQKNDALWQKIVAWGAELAPNNPLFAGATITTAGIVTAAAAAPEVPPPATNEVFDIGLDLDALSSEMEAAGSSDSDFNVDLGLDFSDFGSEESSEVKGEEPAAEVTESFLEFGEAPAEEEATSLDFDLGSFGGEAELSEPVASEPVQAEETLLGDLDFDLSALAEEAPAEEESSAALDFGDLDLGAMAEEAQESDSESALDFSSLDFGSSEELPISSEGESLDFGALDLGTSTEAEAPTMDLSDFGELGDFGDLGDEASFGGMDEVGTKLDLAKAYVDMGDAEGARGMLEEVMQEGSEEQKQQAKDLLAQIA